MLPLAILAVSLGIGAALLHLGAIPARYLPWGPIDLAEAPTVLTPWKLNALKADPQACFAALDALPGLNASRVPKHSTDEGCGWDNALRVRSDLYSYTNSFVARCPTAAALAMLNRHAIAPAAKAYLDSKVIQVEHIGSYACRPIRGKRRLSEHAHANALDITGFRLADGRRITLSRDWRRRLHFGMLSPEARFLLDVRGRACRIFNVVLSPDRDALHANHFHLDMGPFRACD